MTGIKKIITCLLFLFLVASLASSLELTEGRIRLVLHEGAGRFSLYYLATSPEQRYLPLLVDEDYRTTVLSVVIGNRIYRMGEAASFKEEALETGRGARFTWTSKNLVVTEDFSFLTSKGAPLADGVRITLSLNNISDRNLDVGVRMLFDTYLAEGSDAHFQTDSGDMIQGETTYAQANVPNYWLTPTSEDSPIGLQVMTRGALVSPPDSVVFANWKRLSDASWTYETSGSRNFNLLPYSVNDSAACHYYDPVTIPSGSSRSVSILMGNRSPEGFVASAQGDITEILEKATTGVASVDSSLAVAADIQTVNELLEKIDDIIAERSVSDSDLELINKIIQELKKKHQVE